MFLLSSRQESLSRKWRRGASPVLGEPGRAFERASGDVPGRLCRMWETHPGSVSAARRPAGLLQRLLQQQEVGSSGKATETRHLPGHGKPRSEHADQGSLLRWKLLDRLPPPIAPEEPLLVALGQTHPVLLE